MGEAWMDYEEAKTVYNETGFDPFYYFTPKPEEDKLKSEYLIVFQNDDYVFIQDTGHDKDKMTVTNDAENVVKDLYDNFELKNRRLIYRDSEGQIDEILHNGEGGFLKFTAGHKGIKLPPVKKWIIEQVKNMDEENLEILFDYIFSLLDDEETENKTWCFICNVLS